jgi:hypothetical protein
MIPHNIIINARLLLEELKTILQAEGEMNWINGILAAIHCLEDPDVERGYAEAKSIYKTMIGGHGAFSDYYIKREEFEIQRQANARLDDIRNKLWQLFQVDDTSNRLNQ